MYYNELPALLRFAYTDGRQLGQKCLALDNRMDSELYFPRRVLHFEIYLKLQYFIPMVIYHAQQIIMLYTHINCIMLYNLSI